MHKSMLIITAGRLMQAVLGVAALKLMTSLLSPAEVGNFYLILSVVGFCVLTLISPFGMYINRRLHKWAADGTVLSRLNNGHLYLAGVSVLSLLVSFILARWFGVGGTIATGAFVLLVASYVYFSTLNQTLISSLNMLERRMSFVVLTVATLAAGLGLSVYFLKAFSPTAVSWMSGQVLAMFIVNFAALYIFRRAVKGGTQPGAAGQKLSDHDLAPVLAFAWPLGATYLFMWAQTMSHRLIVENMIGPEFLGLIGVGFGIAASMGATLESIVQQFYLPFFYKQISAADSASRAEAWNRMARLTLPLYLSFAIAVSCLAPFLLRIFASGHYHNAAIFLVCGAWVEFFRMSTNVLSSVAHSEMKTRHLVKSYLIGAVISAGGTYLAALHPQRELLIPAVLVAGAAAVMGVMYLDMRKLMPMRALSREWVPSLLASCLFPAALPLWYLSSSFKASLGIGVLFGACFVAAHYYITARRLMSVQEAVPPRAQPPAQAAAEGATLSVAIPTYNGAAHISKTLESILCQSAPGVEVLVSDNCSTDETPDVVRAMVRKYPNLKYFRNESNVGYDRNVDQAMRRATGDFVWLVGDDDVVLPGALKRVAGIVAANPGCSVVFVNCPRPTIVEEESAGLCPDGEEFLVRTKFKSGFVSTNVFSRRLWQQVDVAKYFESGWIHIGFSIEALQRAPSYVEPEYCVDYIRDESAKQRWGGDGGFMYVGLRLVEIYQQLPGLGYSQDMFRKALWSVKGGYLRNIPLAKAKGFKPDRAFLSECIRYYKGFASFWLVDLPILLTPGFVFKGMFQIFKAVVLFPSFRTGKSS